jgi:hypothetical protein
MHTPTYQRSLNISGWFLLFTHIEMNRIDGVTARNITALFLSPKS